MADQTSFPRFLALMPVFYRLLLYHHHFGCHHSPSSAHITVTLVNPTLLIGSQSARSSRTSLWAMSQASCSVSAVTSKIVSTRVVAATLTLQVFMAFSLSGLASVLPATARASR